MLLTDQVHSFTIFNYGSIEWTTGASSGGDKTTGLGVGDDAIAAQVSIYPINLTLCSDVRSVYISGSNYGMYECFSHTFKVGIKKVWGNYGPIN